MSSPGETRILVFGFSDLGYRCLEHLIDRGEKIVGCFTYSDPPGPTGWPPSLPALCARREIPVWSDVKWSPEEIFHARTLAPDLIFSFYYRELIPKGVLALARLGAFNMHGALLPKYRGRAPVNWAVLEGESETGATLHAMVEKADAGPIVDFEKVPIGPEETAFDVQKKVIEAAVRILDRQMENLKRGTAPRRAQNLSDGFYRGRRRPEDGQIDWNRPSQRVHDLVRAVTHPYPGAYTDIFGGKTFIWKTRLPGLSVHDSYPGQIYVEDRRLFVCCGDDRYIEILVIQTEGQPELTAAQWVPRLEQENR
jgi:methionyl-tRNA formyltransferase